MKRHLAIFLLAFLLGLMIFFQVSQPLQQIFIPWRILYSMQSHGTRLLGSFTMSQSWSVTWRCTSSFTSTLILQIDDRQGNSLRETEPCDGNASSGPIHELGTFYLAVTTEGAWMLQIQESPVEYEVITNWGYHSGFCACMARRGQMTDKGLNLLQATPF